MCAPPAQRDLGQIGKRNVMKRHTTSCAIPPTKRLLLNCVNVKCVAKSSGVAEVWINIWKFTKMNNDTSAHFAHWDLTLIPKWEVMKRNNTSLSLFLRLKSLRSLLNMDSDSDFPLIRQLFACTDEQISKIWCETFNYKRGRGNQCTIYRSVFFLIFCQINAHSYL